MSESGTNTRLLSLLATLGLSIMILSNLPHIADTFNETFPDSFKTQHEALEAPGVAGAVARPMSDRALALLQ